MTPLVRSHWSKPASILFATEVPPDEKLFSFALAEALRGCSRLILFHAYDSLTAVSTEMATGVRYYDLASASRGKEELLKPFAERARAHGIECEVVVCAGAAAERITAVAKESCVDRIVMGTRSPGRLDKFLLGSVAESVLRSATVPVCILGPNGVDRSVSGYRIDRILCAVEVGANGNSIVALAAEMALANKARLVLVNVVRPVDWARMRESLAEGCVESQLEAMIPVELRRQLDFEVRIVTGEPAEEILYQSNAVQADLLIMGAHGAPAFSTLVMQGVAYRVLAHAQMPVLTLSPLVRERDSSRAAEEQALGFLAGVF
jgi:nucleotide-binding universal stress UspA family protein